MVKTRTLPSEYMDHSLTNRMLGCGYLPLFP